MKSKIALFLAMAALVIGGLVNPIVVKAYQPIDQVNSNGIDGYWKIKTHNWVGQTFKPTKDRLDAVGVRVSGNGGTAQIRIWINDYTTTTNIGGWDVTIPDGENWAYVDFAPDLEINTSHIYAIYISTLNDNAYWSVATTNTYSGGKAIVDGSTVATQDFAFITYGYNNVPAESPTPAPSDSGTPAPSPTVSSTPISTPVATSTPEATTNAPTSASVTSIVVNPALNLAASYTAKSKSVTLNWDKSVSTDLTGYKILRSEKKDSDFIQVNTVKSDILTFNDNTIKESKTYYYKVRAYKDDIEAKDSNIVTVIVPKFPVTATTKDGSDTSASTTNWTMIALGSALIILILASIIYIVAKKNKKNNISEPQSDKEIK